jgi:hypothetical protein
MDLHREAEEHLRTIRTLMERATVYRAISAPTARVAAVIGLMCGTFVTRFLPSGGSGWDFKILWLGALAVTLGANAWFIHRDARRRFDPFLSPGMRLALRAVMPPALCGLLATVVLAPSALPAAWMLCYGLALLATAPFAPRSIVWLGWAFLVTGLIDTAALAVIAHGFDVPLPSPQHTMAFTFGFYHGVYVLALGRSANLTDGVAETV